MTELQLTKRHPIPPVARTESSARITRQNVDVAAALELGSKKYKQCCLIYTNFTFGRYSEAFGKTIFGKNCNQDFCSFPPLCCAGIITKKTTVQFRHAVLASSLSYNSVVHSVVQFCVSTRQCISAIRTWANVLKWLERKGEKFI